MSEVEPSFWEEGGAWEAFYSFLFSLLILISLNHRPSNFTAPPLPVVTVPGSFWKYGGNSEIPGRLGIFGAHFPANPYFPRKQLG